MPYWINQTDLGCAISVLGFEPIDLTSGVLSRKGRGSRISISYLRIHLIKDISRQQTESRR